MKKIDHDETTGTQIDALELMAFRGRLSRRSFMAGLVQLGVSIGVAGTMATRAEAACLGRMTLQDVYDYIVVGSGTAGSVMASRISASGATVLLIEAGSEQLTLPKISQSEYWLDNLGSESDWNFPLALQPGFNNRQVNAAAGKTVGGSGSINAMFWLRGDIRDYRQWQQQVGHNWHPYRMYQAFKRVENFLPKGGPDRGHGGAISVGRYAPDNPITAASIAGAKELGLAEVDHNASTLIDGAGAADVNILPDGRRSGPAQAYLIPALETSCISLLSDALVTRVTLHGTRCNGIDAVVNGKTRHFSATREVLLCAGAIGSPRILMQSGIGSVDTLNAVGITVRHHLPAVGKNLQDHTLLPGIHFNGGPELSAAPTLGRIASHTFLRTNPVNKAPNIQVMCMQTPFPPNALPTGDGFSILPWVSKPQSRGTVTLTGADPSAPLIIDPGYLRENQDRETLLTALDFAIALGMTDAMKPFASSIVDTAGSLTTTAKKLAFIAENAANGLHLVGSCSAGKDPYHSVVDQYFQVWGIEGLRVVDASVIPEVPGVNPQASILTLAELAAVSMGLTEPFNQSAAGQQQVATI